MTNIISQHWTSDQEKLESYVLNKLQKKERSLLEAHLEKCGECRNRIAEEQELRRGIQRFGRLEMKRRLKMRLRRDRGRRFEWTYAASIAASIVVVFSGILAIRWFFNFENKGTVVREIVLKESKENEPADHSMWIIGRIVEVKEDIEYAPVPVEKRAEGETADLIAQNPEPALDKKAESKKEDSENPQGETAIEIAGSSKPDSGPAKESAGRLAEVDVSKMSFDDTISGKKEKSDRLFSDRMEEEKVGVKGYITRSTPPAPTSSVSPNPQNVISADMPPKTFSDKDKLLSRIGNDSKITEEFRGKQPVQEHAAQIGAEQKKASKISAGKNLAFRDDVTSERRAIPVRKRRPARNIFVQRGDMKELPASMRTADPLAIQTKFERTPKGVLLTFYSNAIKDTSATYIEAVTSDSIIVSFRNKQIAYRIPGGLGGKM